MVGKMGDTRVRVRARIDGSYELLPTTLPDGSRLQSDDATEKEIRSRLRKAGAEEALIERTVEHFRAGGKVKLQDDVYEPKVGDIDVGLPLDEPITPPEAFLAVGFLFLSLGAESGMYPADESTDPMREVRAALLEKNPSVQGSWVRADSTWEVSMGLTRAGYEPAHMVGFDSTSPPVVQIQLFRELGWTVRLPEVDRVPDRVYFWTHLDTGEESFLVLEEPRGAA
jgi:hypothetical protein